MLKIISGSRIQVRNRNKLMNEDWSQKNKQIQKLLSKEATFDEAVGKLLEFRNELFQQITWIVEGYPEKAF